MKGLDSVMFDSVTCCGTLMCNGIALLVSINYAYALQLTFICSCELHDCKFWKKIWKI